MLEQELKKVWQELKEIWKNSSHTEKINFEMSRLMNDLKGKIGQFEKDSISRDTKKITALMNDLKSKISQFEKDSITRDITKITTSIKKIISQLRTKKQTKCWNKS